MLSLGSGPGSGAVIVTASSGIPCARDWKRSRYRSCNVEDLRTWRRERESGLCEAFVYGIGFKTLNLDTALAQKRQGEIRYLL